MPEPHDPETSGSHGMGTPDIPALSPEIWRRPEGLPGTVPVGHSRAEQAANQIARVAAGFEAGERIGSKDEIRSMCSVSVGTVNEAIKLAQERGVITSRPGPGGGIFAADPTPLSRMNGWFRDAAGDLAALEESIQIRNALAPLLVDEVLATITDADQASLELLLTHVDRTREARDIAGFIWAVWNVHARFAELGRSQLLDSLYLSIMDVGTSHLRARLEADSDGGNTHVTVYFDGLAEVAADFVHALGRRDADAAVDALRRTDPTMTLRPPTR
ncbi:FCD domain-containing protein [Gordonia sp. Z-3]|uniref:FadR/GntR family transcriptional regulator n=1 Tax=Gordonia sp. Z-3 TaxID=3115408 RepID=UPI002E27B73A|nr:FCD domain-containing protein [Gordonia sp. Z-3]MED5803687.1 FCD domain-containing protein [Gordonia sp. Z-3]